jgi:hypothetical protein
MKFQSIHIDSHTNKILSVLSSLALSMLFLLTTFSLQAHSASKIVKWKDEKGMTHYGDSVPAQYANRESSEISKQGIIVKRNKPVNMQEQELDVAKQVQDKKDNALTNAFTNANEIDLARDRNLQLDLVAIEGLQLQKKNSLKRLAERQKYANNFIKRNKPIPADLSTEIKSNQALITNQEQQINERKVSMEATRKRFDDDKIRYIALKNKTIDSNTSTEAQSNTKP